MTIDIFHSELIEIDNDELAGVDGFLGDTTDVESIIVYSRDWTVETVVNQIIKGNIDLNPEFQRRNAWNDSKKSSLIESYLIGYPVPEIVLAEHPREKKKFIVIDGKQRLLTLCGFLMHEKFNSWRSPKLSKLKDIKELNGKTFSDLKKERPLNKYLRHLANADVRCTVISNISSDDILYDIFYRLNAGATPLSTQELRQVLYAGSFSNFLLKYTSNLTKIHDVLKLQSPDDRLKDVETLLRLLSMIHRINDYNGNLKKHLDEYTYSCNEEWGSVESRINHDLNKIDSIIETLSSLLGGYDKVGRKWNSEKNDFEARFNTVLFEVQVYFAFYSENLSSVNAHDFQKEFKKLCDNSEFNASISSSTKNIKEYTSRFNLYSEFMKKLCNEEIEFPWMA